MSLKPEEPATRVLTCDVPGCGRQQSFAAGRYRVQWGDQSIRIRAAEMGWYAHAHAGDVCPHCCAAAVANHVRDLGRPPESPDRVTPAAKRI